MKLAGIEMIDTPLVRDAMDLARSSSEPFLYNHVMRSWLFGIVLSQSRPPAPDAELLAVATLLHDLGLTDHFEADARFEVDGANASRSFLQERGIPDAHIRLVWDAIALHSTGSIALHKEPIVAVTFEAINADAVGYGLERIPENQLRAILAEFPRMGMKKQITASFCRVVREKPAVTYDNTLRDFGVRFIEGYNPPSGVDLVANAPFVE
jgi:hypothetical protein